MPPQPHAKAPSVSPWSLSTRPRVKLAYALIDLGSLLALGVVFFAAILALHVLWQVVASYWVLVPAVLVAFIGANAVHACLRSVHSELEARIRVHHQRILKMEVLRDDRAPFLFLRSFRRSGLRVGIERQEMVGEEFRPSRGYKRVPVDRIRPLLSAVSGRGPFVALSTARDTSITRDDIYELAVELAWTDRVMALCRVVRAIILVPDSSEGVVAEMRMLSTLGVLNRVLVYMPPWIPAQDPPDGLEHRWNEIRDELAVHRWQLPTYERRGCLYVPDVHFGAVTTEYFSGQRDRHFREALDGILSRLPPPPSSPADLEPLLS
jgi:hypothetical protein